MVAFNRRCYVGIISLDTCSKAAERREGKEMGLKRMKTLSRLSRVGVPNRPSEVIFRSGGPLLHLYCCVLI